MLTVSPLMSLKNERERGFSMEEYEFQEFTSENLLDSIDFDDIFVGISDGDVLPDLEMHQEFLADFSVSAESEMKMSEMEEESNSGNSENVIHPAAPESVSASGSEVGFGPDQEIMSKMEESVVDNPPGKEESRKSSKNPLVKKKPKVDWTPELHRRFVQAVEQLGLDKAVPSRILEIMGIDTLTRHNIASHLQKYRSHRKHLLAREAEAASWSHRRPVYSATAAGGRPAKREINPWIAPTMGFPPVAPLPHFRPLHVWGHPSADQSLMTTWPKHVAPLPSLPPWPPADPPFWHSGHHQYVPTTGTPCFPPYNLLPPRFPCPSVAGVPPPATYKVDPTLTQAPSEVHPSKESIDAAIGDVIAKPWLPLPLGLKPPSMDSVMSELQRQGVSKIPPSSS